MHLFKTENYRCLEIVLRTGPERPGRVQLLKQGVQTAEEYIDIHRKKWLRFPIKQNETYELIYEHVEPGIIYLSGNDDIYETGVQYLPLTAEDSMDYDLPYRDQYHFMPHRNWLNDPNGVCWFKGKYHLFYQANPFEQKWDDMYWGHAVSDDLVHWKHLPLVLEPQEEICGNPELSGGAFSGCAVPAEEEVYFFLTRHLQMRGDDNTVREWQTMMKSSDMLNFSEEKVIIPRQPTGAGRDFRDPNVSKIGDMYYMVLASNIGEDLAMLLYSSDNLEQWRYEKPLLTDREEGATTYECPDFFELDGKYVAMAALMKYTDEYGRYQMSRYYIGEFEAQQLRTEQTGWLDFGGDFYAVQTFQKDDQRIAIGWTADFHEEHVEMPQGSNGGFAIPRVLHVRNSRLTMEPVPQIYELKKEMLYQGTDSHIQIKNIEGNAYYAELKFKGNTDFNILLGRSGDSEIRLLGADGVLEIRTSGVNSEKVRFPIEVEQLAYIEVFTDRRTVEVYVNHGYAVGTKLFFNENRHGIFEAEFEQEEMLSMAELHTMESVWK